MTLTLPPKWTLKSYPLWLFWLILTAPAALLLMLGSLIGYLVEWAWQGLTDLLPEAIGEWKYQTLDRWSRSFRRDYYERTKAQRREES